MAASEMHVLVTSDLAGGRVTPVFQELPLASLVLDSNNPRLPVSLRGADRQKILEFMIDDAGLIELMASISSQGFFPGEPLLVCPFADAHSVVDEVAQVDTRDVEADQASETDNSERWLVVEGNRRLAACFILSDPLIAPSRNARIEEIAASGAAPSGIPCLIFENRESIIKHLGYRHVTGIKEWGPLAKAQYLRQLYEATSGNDRERFREIAKTIGSRSDYVGRLLTAFTLYEMVEEDSFYNVPFLNETSLNFSLISSMLAYSSFIEFLGLESSQDLRAVHLDRARLANMIRWMFDRSNGKTRLGESRNLKFLAAVVADENALAAFETGLSLTAAVRIAEGSDVLREFMKSAIESIDLAIVEADETETSVDDAALSEEVASRAGRLSDLVHQNIPG